MNRELPRVLRTALQILALLIAIFLALEISLRLMFFGLDALSPAKMNSHVLILDSNFVKASDYPDIGYDLKPNIDSLFRGKHFISNAVGMPDQDYAMEKPANVFRIAVIGSSWSMPTGVAAEKAYHVLLEERLKDWPPGKTTEILNFAVEYYGLGEMVATVRDKALAYDPDIILFTITSNTPDFLWEDNKEPFVQIDSVAPFYRSYVLSAFMEAIGRPFYTNAQRPRIKNPYGDYMRQIRRSMESLKPLVANRDTEVIVIWFSHDKLNESMLRNTERHARDQGFEFLPLNLRQEADRLGREGNLLTGRIDQHPNEAAHEIIAEVIYTKLVSPHQQ
jgi:hypothetical protein